MKKLYIGLAIIAIIAIIAIPRIISNQDDSSAPEKINRITVETKEAKRGTLTTTIELTGNIKADSTINIIPLVPAEVKEIYVKVGDKVQAGDLLFALDESDMKKQVEQAEIGLQSAEAALKQANLGISNANLGVEQATTAYDMAQSNYEMNLANYEFAANNLSKYEQLYSEGIISTAELEQMQLQASPETLTLLQKQLEQAEQALNQAQIGVQNAQVGVEQAEAGYNQAQLGYDTAVEALEDMGYTAPVGGYITTMNLVKNQMASSAQVAITIDVMDKVAVETSVTESVINKLSIGQEVTAEIRTIEGETFIGVINTLSPSANAITLLYPMTIEIPNENNIIKPGMFATIKATKDRAENVLYIPSAGMLLKDNKHYVYVVNGSDTPELREVVIGLDTGDEIEIKEGLSEGERVITTGLGLINEDTLITEVRGDE